jgi:hypothetical protein
MGYDRSRLTAELAYLFDRKQTLQRLARDACIDTTDVDLDGSQQDRWDAVLREAEKCGRLPRLLELASQRFPGRDVLSDALRKSSASSAGQGSDTTVVPILTAATAFVFDLLGRRTVMAEAHAEHGSGGPLTLSEFRRMRDSGALTAAIDGRSAAGYAHRIAGLHRQLDLHARTLTDYETQATKMGLHTPPYVRRGIEEETEAIARTGSELKDLLRAVYGRALDL